MHNRIECMRCEKPIQQTLIPQVALNEHARLNQFTVAGGKVVQNDDITTGIDQSSNHMSSDIPGPTAHYIVLFVFFMS